MTYLAVLLLIVAGAAWQLESKVIALKKENEELKLKLKLRDMHDSKKNKKCRNVDGGWLLGSCA